MRHVYREDTYPVDIRIGFLASILFFIFLFLFIPRPAVEPYQLKKSIEFKVIDLPPNFEIVEEPPKVNRPNIIIPVDDPEEANIGTIDPTVPDNRIVITRPEVELRPFPFWKVEKKPKILESFPPRYPQIAQELGWEGDCVVQVVVGIDGRVKEAEILKSTHYDVLDKAALEVVYEYRFTPGYQRDRPVPVRWNIPIRFQLD